MSEEYEYETDYKKIAMIGVIITIGVVAGLHFSGLVPFVFVYEIKEKVIDEIDQNKIDLPEGLNLEWTEQEVFEKEPDVTSIPSEQKNVINIEPEPLDPIEQRLTDEFLTFGLTLEEIEAILNDDCINYENQTEVEPKYQKLYLAKTELCFGAVQGE